VFEVYEVIPLSFPDKLFNLLLYKHSKSDKLKSGVFGVNEGVNTCDTCDYYEDS